MSGTILQKASRSDCIDLTPKISRPTMGRETYLAFRQPLPLRVRSNVKLLHTHAMPPIQLVLLLPALAIQLVELLCLAVLITTLGNRPLSMFLIAACTSPLSAETPWIMNRNASIWTMSKLSKGCLTNYSSAVNIDDHTMFKKLLKPLAVLTCIGA
eukprot:4354442-Amphidinium_carterae.1